MNTTNTIIEELLSDDGIDKPKRLERYERGMFISINNHKQGNDDLYGAIKKQYQSILYALTGENVSREGIKVSDKLPSQNAILKLMAKRTVVIAAAFHSYNSYNMRTGRGSRFNSSGYNHLHLYAYGLHHLMKEHNGGVDAAVNHIKGCLFRHNRFADAKNPNNIDIREVGVGKYHYNDVVTPTTLLDYLSLPKTNPAKECVINYMAGTVGGGGVNPILYVYQTGVK